MTSATSHWPASIAFAANEIIADVGRACPGPRRRRSAAAARAPPRPLAEHPLERRGRVLEEHGVDRVLLDARIGERIGDRLDRHRQRRTAGKLAVGGMPDPGDHRRATQLRLTDHLRPASAPRSRPRRAEQPAEDLLVVFAQPRARLIGSRSTGVAQRAVRARRCPEFGMLDLLEHSARAQMRVGDDFPDRPYRRAGHPVVAQQREQLGPRVPAVYAPTTSSTSSIRSTRAWRVAQSGAPPDPGGPSASPGHPVLLRRRR